ncbi:MAG: hypothetical protein ACREFO_09390, partial [Acetobacteraceae bacterium]
MQTIGTEAAKLSDLLTPWHDFYIVTGTAGATLVGLLFVAASLGSGVFTEERRPHFRAFVSPSVAHFSSALALSLAALAPLHRWLLLALIEGGVAVFGLAYSSIVWGAMVRLGITATLDLEDRIWYAALPALAYAVVVATAIALWAERPTGLSVLPLG